MLAETVATAAGSGWRWPEMAEVAPIPLKDHFSRGLDAPICQPDVGADVRLQSCVRPLPELVGSP